MAGAKQRFFGSVADLNALPIIAPFKQDAVTRTGVQLTFGNLSAPHSSSLNFAEVLVNADEYALTNHMKVAISVARDAQYADYEGIYIYHAETDAVYGIAAVGLEPEDTEAVIFDALATVQRSGLPVGTLLLTAVIYTAFYVRDFKRIQLTVTPGSRAHAMYLRLGFLAPDVYDEAELTLDASNFSQEILQRLLNDRQWSNRKKRVRPNDIVAVDQVPLPFTGEFLNMHFEMREGMARFLATYSGIVGAAMFFETEPHIFPKRVEKFTGTLEEFLVRLGDHMGTLRGWLLARHSLGQTFQILVRKVPASDYFAAAVYIKL